jgi:hypothetical protein
LTFASCPIEEHEHKTPAVRPWAMHECLTQKTSSIAISTQVAQLLQTGACHQHRQDRTIRAIFQEPQVNSFTTITNYTKMASFSSLDDMSSIRLKIEEKAHDLFKEKSGQALFSVTRILGCQENGKFFEKDRKVLNLSHIKMLRNVRMLLE